MDGWTDRQTVSICIAHHHRKISNALDTPVLSEQECFQWTSERHVGSRRSADSEFQVVGPATAKDRQPSELSWKRSTCQCHIFKDLWLGSGLVSGTSTDQNCLPQLGTILTAVCKWRVHYGMCICYSLMCLVAASCLSGLFLLVQSFMLI